MARMKTVTGMVVVLCLLGCSTNKRWSDQKRKDFEVNCLKTEVINNLTVSFRGFGEKDLSTVTVKEYNGKKLINTFAITVEPFRGPWEKENKVRYATIQRALSIKHVYEFRIPGQRPRRLADMKMVLWPQYTMYSEGWGCVMGEYTLDGVPFKKDTMPTFVKKP